MSTRFAQRVISFGLALTGLAAGMLVTAAPASANNPAVCEMSHGAYYFSQWQVAHSAVRGTDCTLRQGANWYAVTSWGMGKEQSGVYALQMALRHCHGHNIAVDGYFGPATTQALKNVQSSIGTYPDGVLGPRTSAKMGWMTPLYQFPCKPAANPGPRPQSSDD